MVTQPEFDALKDRFDRMEERFEQKLEAINADVRRLESAVSRRPRNGGLNMPMVDWPPKGEPNLEPSNSFPKDPR